MVKLNSKYNTFITIENKFININDFIFNNEFIDIIGLINEFKLPQSSKIEINQLNSFSLIDLLTFNFNKNIVNITSDEETLKNLLLFLDNDNNKILNLDNTNYIIKNYINVENKEIILELKDEIINTNFKNIQIYDWYSSVSIDVEYLNENESDLTILSNHRTDNLINYNPSFTKKDNKFNIYNDVYDMYSSFSPSIFYNINFDEFNIDFSDFSNHTFFSSAKAKVINAIVKLNKYYTVTEISSSYYSNEYKQQLVNEFSPFEKWLYANKYVTLTYNDFFNYMNNLLIEAEIYDDKNNNMIWNVVPSPILEDDTNGYLSNLLLLIAEIFDLFYLFNNSLLLLNENPHKENTINTRLIKDKLESLGFTEDFFYTADTLAQQYNGTETEKWEDSIRYVSEQIAKRLVHNLPHLYQSKGTLKTLKSLLNIYSIPDNFFEIVEFNKNDELSSSIEMKWSENWWYLKKTPSITCSLNITNTDVTENNTFEFVVNNFFGNIINLANFGQNRFYLELNSSGSYTLNYEQSSSLIFSSSFTIPNNNLWTYIGIAKDSNNSCSLFTIQQNEYGELINKNEQNVNSVSYGTYTNFIYLSASKASITEVAVYSSKLDDEEMLDHGQDFRSLAEIETTSSLVCKFTFLKNSGSLTNNGFTLSITNANPNDYLIDEFYSITNTFSLNDVYTNKMVSIDIPIDTSKEKNLYYDYRDDLEGKNYNENYVSRLGIFISPSEHINRQIVRNIISDKETIPDNLLTYNEVFSNELDNKKILDNISDKFSNMSYYNFLYNLVNNKLFKIFKKFVPSNVKFEYGLMIRNHILKTNKMKIKESKMDIKASEVRLYNNIGGVIAENLNDKSVIVGTNLKSVSSSKMIQFDKMLKFELKKGNLLYLNMINTIQSNLLSTYLKNNISGNSRYKTYLYPIETIINNGATFIKR